MRRRSAVLAIAFLVTIVLSGCGKSLPTGPEVTTEPAMSKAPVNTSAATSSYNWVQVASQWVNKGDAATVSGSRYKVQLVRGGLSAGATIEILERDPAVLDVVIGPNGTALAKAGTLTISYAGTAAAATPSMLKFWRFNESTGAWEAVSFTNDLAAQALNAKVSVLCRYAVSAGDPTKAGW
jgi:hypothetical protein